MRLYEVYNIPRNKMPQINKSHLESYPKTLQVVDINKVTPSQSDRVPGLVDKTLKAFKAGEKELMDKPMVVDRDMNIVNGHHRYDVLKQMGMTRVPVLKVDATLPELIDDFSHTTSNRPVKEVKYTEPKLDVEWEEANRYPYLANLGQAGWVELAKQGKAITVDSDSVKKIGNTGADGSETLDDLEPDKVDRLNKSMQSGKVEMPIVIKQPNGSLELVAGNTRLIGLINKLGKAVVWYVDASNLTSDKPVAEGPKDFDDMKLDQKGKQDSIDYFYRTHAPRFGNPKKAGSFKGHSVVTFKTPEGVLMFFVDQNDQAVFYIGLDNMPDGVAVGNVRSNGTIKATEVYRYLVSKYGKLYSDKHQTPDGRKIWANLAKYNPELKISDAGDRLMAVAEGNKAQLGIPANATDAELRKARKAGGAKGKRAHWLLNMRKGNRKKK